MRNAILLSLKIIEMKFSKERRPICPRGPRITIQHFPFSYIFSIEIHSFMTTDGQDYTFHGKMISSTFYLIYLGNTIKAPFGYYHCFHCNKFNPMLGFEPTTFQLQVLAPNYYGFSHNYFVPFLFFLSVNFQSALQSKLVSF